MAYRKQMRYSIECEGYLRDLTRSYCMQAQRPPVSSMLSSRRSMVAMGGRKRQPGHGLSWTRQRTMRQQLQQQGYSARSLLQDLMKLQELTAA